MWDLLKVLGLNALLLILSSLLKAEKLGQYLKKALDPERHFRNVYPEHSGITVGKGMLKIKSIPKLYVCLTLDWTTDSCSVTSLPRVD